MTLQADIDQMNQEVTHLNSTKSAIHGARSSLDTTNLVASDFSFLGMDGPYKIYIQILDKVKSLLVDGEGQFDDAATVLTKVAEAFQDNDDDLSTKYNAWNPDA